MSQICSAVYLITAPRVLIFSIVLVAEYSFCVKSIATYAPHFLYNNSVLAIVLLLSSAFHKKLVKTNIFDTHTKASYSNRIHTYIHSFCCSVSGPTQSEDGIVLLNKKAQYRLHKSCFKLGLIQIYIAKVRTRYDFSSDLFHKFLSVSFLQKIWSVL